ncbi:MAG: fluoride efflux transporter CrcB [Tannerellaceae bacterium]|jgi:CrcB protein|nr:fluoride efflux transporter CrcB [Tannerellaceae bacterium]
MIKQLLFVGLGGGAGSILRYLITLAVHRWHPAATFPLATFLANTTGCILIGFLIGLSARHGWMDSHVKLLLVTGFCGGYTTFSTFSLESIRLLENHHYLLLALYIAGSLLAGITSVGLGLLLSKL